MRVWALARWADYGGLEATLETYALFTARALAEASQADGDTIQEFDLRNAPLAVEQRWKVNDDGARSYQTNELHADYGRDVWIDETDFGYVNATAATETDAWAAYNATKQRN